MKKQGLLLPPTEKMDKLIAAVEDPRDSCLLWLLRNGLRCSEAINLKTSDLFSDGEDVFARVNGKGDKVRDVPLFKKTVMAVGPCQE